MKEGQWYPGNMTRAVRRLQEDLKVVDLVVELLDARIPACSGNPQISRLLTEKKRLVVLHKADRAEPALTTRWLSYFRNDGLQSIPFSVNAPGAANGFFRLLAEQERQMRPARLKRPLRLIVAGIPNVGKSTLINLLVGRAVTRTGNTPGITRGRQWIRLLPGVELLDTPGVLWPNLSRESVIPLAVVGSLPAGQVDIEEAALWLLKRYRERGREKVLVSRYRGLEAEDPATMLEQIGLTQGCLQQEGKVDLQRAASLLLRDFQNGTLGRFTLEEPPL